MAENEIFDISQIKFGCKLSPKDIRDYQVKASAVSAELLPTSFRLDIPKKIKNLGMTGSCVAHTTSEILEYFALADLNKDVTLSTNFIYGTQKKLYDRTGEGMMLIDACKTVTKYGDPLVESCPGNKEVPLCYSSAEKALSSEKVLKEAGVYRVDSYFNCSSNNDIKYALYKYQGPILCAIKWYNKYGFTNKKTGEIYFNTNSDFGYHAVMLYGWNETGWLFQNSWGTTFGNKGLFILPYKYGIVEAKVLIDYQNPDEDKYKEQDQPLPQDDENLVIPDTLDWAEIIVKAINAIINLFKKN